MNAKKLRTEYFLLGVLTALLCGCVAKAPAPVAERNPVIRTGSHVEYVYRVNSGDTLYAISKLHGLDVPTVAAMNNLDPPYIIQPGQLLRVVPQNEPSYTDGGERDEGATSELEPLSESDEVATQTVSQSTTTSTPLSTATPQVQQPVTSESSTTGAANQSAVQADPKPASNVQKGGRSWRWPVDEKPVQQFTPTRKGLDYKLDKNAEIVSATSGEVIYAGIGLNKFKHMIIVDTNANYLVAYEFNTDLAVAEKQILSAGERIAKIASSSDQNDDVYRQFHFEIWKDGHPIDPNVVIKP